ncbi:MAG: HEAT repeat domain-containing protein [Pirellulales bacterium]|nr:HEAT repeat domain-containing protein [Pirellulales bacterium]
MSVHSNRLIRSNVWLWSALSATCLFTGCQDGPLYALKTINPYYTLNEWKADEALGISDHQRRQQLAGLANSIGDLPAERQQFWSGQLTAMLENDPSPEMRRLAVLAARSIHSQQALAIIEKGLDDESMKVRMEACRALGHRPEEQAARLLAATVGTEANEDVKRSALEALANHQNQIAVDSLRLALSDRDPATRTIAVESLRGATGKNYGDDPDVWIAALEGKPAEEVPAGKGFRRFF